SHLLKFALRRMQEMIHRHGAVVICGKEGRGQSDVFDVAAGKLELAGKKVEVDITIDGHTAGPDTSPDAAAFRLSGKREMDRERESSNESFVEHLPYVCGKDWRRVVLVP